MALNSLLLLLSITRNNGRRVKGTTSSMYRYDSSLPELDGGHKHNPLASLRCEEVDGDAELSSDSASWLKDEEDADVSLGACPAQQIGYVMCS